MQKVKTSLKKDDILFVFEKHFKLWYQLGSIYSSQCKDHTEFMSKLYDIANACSFANKDEIVKFLFLIHDTMRGLKIS